MLSMAEYKMRAEPRLAAIDAMDKRCEWSKWDFECTPEVQALRERRNRLMSEQIADEVDAGL